MRWILVRAPATLVFIVFSGVYFTWKYCGIVCASRRHHGIFSDEFGGVYRSSIVSEKGRDLKAQLMKFVETWTDSTGFLFVFVFSFMYEYVMVCASCRHNGILGDDEIGRVHRSSIDYDRNKAGRLQ